jgi:hypothetical protein
MRPLWSAIGGIAQRILNLNTRRRWVISFTTRLFPPPEKEPSMSIGPGAGSQGRSGWCREEKILLPLSGMEHRLIGISVYCYWRVLGSFDFYPCWLFHFAGNCERINRPAVGPKVTKLQWTPLGILCIAVGCTGFPVLCVHVYSC